MRVSLNPSTDPADYPFVHRLRTRFAETDAMGVIHHGAYATYLEEARVELLRAGGYPYDRVRAEGTEFPVLEIYVRYRQPLRFADDVAIWVAAGELTRTTFQFSYLLEVDGATCTTAVTVHGAVDRTGSPVRLPLFVADIVPTAYPGARGS